MVIKKIHVWRSRFSTPAVFSGNTYIHYIEDIIFFTTLVFFFTLFLGALASWMFHFDFYPLPPETDMVGRSLGEQYILWSKSIIHGVLPFLFKQDAEKFSLYLKTLNHYGFGYLLITRMAFSTILASIFGILTFRYIASKPVKYQVETHLRGIQFLETDEAIKELSLKFKNEIDKFGKFTEISNKLYLSMKRLFTHTIIFGASGTGKSVYLTTAINDAIKMGLKALILDPKYEFTAMFYKNDRTMAILDATDNRSSIPRLADFISSIGMAKKFAAALIPAKGNDPLWSNAARAVFVGLCIYLMKTFKDKRGKPNPTWEDLSNVVISTPEQVIYIMENYYPEALKLVGEIDKQTNQVVVNDTTTSIMINLLAFMGGIRDLGRFWYNDPKNPLPEISLSKFMTDPNYKIKTIFIKPNDMEAEMSHCMIRSVLTFCISMLDSPKIPDSDIPNGVFFLDEFHAPGKLLNELDQPVIDKGVDRGRSKKWAFYLATQNIIQLYKIYTKEDVDSWRETTSNFILTGAPLGETANKVCEYLGEEFIDKLHLSISNSSSGSNSSKNYQEHSKKVLLPSELTSELQITDTHIRYLAILRGMPNVYLLEKEFVNFPKIASVWEPRKELEDTSGYNNRVSNTINASIKAKEESKVKLEKTQPKEENKDSDIKEEQPKSEEYEIIGEFIDNGQYADAMSEEEIKHNESVEGEAIKDVVLESTTDSHALGITTTLLDKIFEKAKHPESNMVYQQALKKVASTTTKK